MRHKTRFTSLIIALLTVLVIEDCPSRVCSFASVQGLVSWCPQIDNANEANDSMFYGAITEGAAGTLDRHVVSYKSDLFEGVNCPLPWALSLPIQSDNSTNHSVPTEFASTDPTKNAEDIIDASLNRTLDAVAEWNRASLTQQETEKLHRIQNCDISITVQPESDTVNRCQQQTLAVTVMADTTVTYQWQRQTGASWVNLANDSQYSGATMSRLLVLAMSSQTGGAYRCVTSTPTCSDTSKVATLWLKNSVPRYVPRDGLVGWWPFTCDADDESGNRHHGAVFGASLAPDRNSRANHAFYFDGVDDFIRSSTSSDLNVASHQQLTLAFWLLPEPSPIQGCVISKNKVLDIKNSSFWIRHSRNKLVIMTDPSNRVADVDANLTEAPGWSHVAVVMDRAKSSISVYRNGKILLNESVRYNDNQATVPLTFGMHTDEQPGTEFSAHYRGLLDDIGFWGRALTQQEIENLYQGQGCDISITSHPSSDTLTRCQQALLTVVAKTDTTVTYQWQHQVGSSWSNLMNGAKYSGMTQPTLTVLSMSSQTEGAYRCIIRAGSCSDTSRTAQLTIRRQLPDYVSRSGLVGWWPFDCYADDESGNGYHGVVIGAAQTSDRYGMDNRAVEFVGSNYIEVSNSQNINFTDELTVNCWFRNGQVQMNNIYVSKHTYGSLSNSSFALFNQMQGGSCGPLAYVTSPGGVISALRSTGLCDSSWHMMTMILKSPSLKMYIDGKYYDSVGAVNSIQSSANPILFGTFSGWTNSSNFKLDDVGIWNRALSDAEVKRLWGEDCAAGPRQYPLDSMNLALSAKVEGTVIALTPSATYQAGSAWLPQKHVVMRGFDVRVRFRMLEGSDNAVIDGGPQGADGIAFILQNASAVATGAAGDGIGYNGLPSGLAVEFDSYQNAAFSDPSPNHIAVQVGDGQVIRPWHVAPFLRGITSVGVPAFTADGTVYHARITLQGQRLSVYCDTTGVLSAPLLTVDSVDIAQILKLDADGSTYLGFTSSTGFSQQRHELLDLSIEECDPLVSVHQESIEPDPALVGRIIPIPARDEARLQFNNPLATPGVIRIYDARGREITAGTIPAGNQSWSLPIADLNIGSYSVQVQMRNTVLVLPLLIIQ